MRKLREAGGELDFSDIRAYSAFDRRNLVTTDSLLTPGQSGDGAWSDKEFPEFVNRVAESVKRKRPVIAFMGAHVIKRGLSRYIIALMREGFITHIAGNGATSIHDFELCYLGGTSEYVPDAIEDGSFGMWEETGAWMNEAIKAGAEAGLGYGWSLAKYIDERPERFPHRDDCVLYQAYKAGVQATYHVAIGTDIIHQHKTADFAAIGRASGADFKKFCASVARMDGGCFLNFGSGVIGPEVFLKALSISRNLGFPTYDITTANFDLRALPDYRRAIPDDDPDYYYRPRKNIVNRPVSRGGRGFNFTADHAQTVPSLYDHLKGLFK